jgi:hypothetical protein
MKKLWVEEFGVVEWVETHTDNGNSWTDASSDMLAWDAAINVMDWSRRRDKISTLFYAEAGTQLENFAGLSDAKKLIGAKYFFIPYALRLAVVGSDEADAANGLKLVTETKASRQAMYDAMRGWVWNQYVRKEVLTLAQSQQFYDDIHIDDELDVRFIETNQFGLKAWIFGLSPYEGVFAGKGYYSVGLQNELILIYNGEY